MSSGFLALAEEWGFFSFCRYCKFGFWFVCEVLDFLRSEVSVVFM